mmetsp:Transcript_66878/g.105807  ORF Transcript_66878/g.105807 Transcript_66878/m.105807 type:complete len:163 (+) Transcript_66878:62-550(+)|eukprot:CAMPEP_0169072660 /NCGR_PEP_ID=MMETSP1015-20121227/6316_1 /TAXON_ID=342587 /ORGANISM="Karlodinium micrum, Strain CCMP2283" /LENGTH=162 /DNA_ID=CAMNT_0009131837 /DNA_START=59 /DNA_END=547 /DNA_ORIENTATION=+
MGHGVYGSMGSAIRAETLTDYTAIPRQHHSHWTAFGAVGGDDSAAGQAATVTAKPPSKDSLPLDIHVIIRKAVGAMTGQVTTGQPTPAPAVKTGATGTGNAAANTQGEQVAPSPSNGPPQPGYAGMGESMLALPPLQALRRSSSSTSERNCRKRKEVLAGFL